MKICWYQTQQIMKALPDYIHFTVLRFAWDGVLDDAFRIYDVPVPRRLANASEQRQAEYLAGRIGAQKLLQHCDIALRAPLMADNRAPSCPSSYKESACKAFSCEHQQHLDFHSVELREIDPHLQQFTFSLTHTLNHEYEAGFRFKGWYAFLGNQVLTLVHLHCRISLIPGNRVVHH
jgi:4'-phosphopantetheinyl transferase EntD